MLIKVENENLYRDTETNAIINTDKKALQKAREIKAAKLRDKQRLENLEEAVSDIDKKLQLILDKLGV